MQSELKYNAMLILQALNEAVSGQVGVAVQLPEAVKMTIMTPWNTSLKRA
jgi:hypothetical protein